MQRSDYDYQLVRLVGPDGHVSTMSINRLAYLRLIAKSKLPPEEIAKAFRELHRTQPKHPHLTRSRQLLHIMQARYGLAQ